MLTYKNKNSKIGGYRRLFGFFRRKKPQLIDFNYSYQYMTRFPRLPITVPPLVPTLMSYRWNDDEEYHTSPKKFLRNSQPQPQASVRRRFSKRYSDLVVPSSNRIYLPRKDSIRQRAYKRKSNENLAQPDCQPKKSHDNRSSLPKNKKFEQSNTKSKPKRYSTTANAVDLLAHRMQAAMSVELMCSLDRNFIVNEKKPAVNRTQSLHFSIQPIDEWWKQPPGHHLIPRVQASFDDHDDEPAPDYDEPEEEIAIHTIENTENTDEPSIDYDESNNTATYELDQTLSTPEDLGVLSSVPTSQPILTPINDINLDYHALYPPTPPPLPTSFLESNRITFRCRTIADQITPDHKLISKSMSIDEKSSPISTPSNRLPPSCQPVRFNLTKEILAKTNLRKVSQPISRSFSTYGSISQLNEPQTHSTITCKKDSLAEEQPSDNILSSAATSIVIENEYEHKKSSKIYNDYKRRTSSINISTSRQAAIIHPIHTHIGFRSSTSSSSTNDKLNDVNICVINQLNQHLTTRIQKQQDSSSKTIVENSKSDIYDELDHLQSSSIPPPPPPLPIGGFRNMSTQPNRSQRTSIMTLARDVNSTGTSTTSSKLSDTRILRELRTNSLFTKAKQHLELESEQNATTQEKLIQHSKQVNTKLHSELELIFQKRTQRVS